MAPKKTSVITVDISSGKVSGQIINYTTMDVNTATLSFQIIKQSIKYPLTDVTAKVFLNMEDGSQFVEDCDIVDSINGVVQYTLKSNEIKHSGRVDGEFYLIYSDSSVGSFNFTFYIKKSAIDTISVPAQEVVISDIETFKASLEARLDDTQATLTSVQQQVTNAQTQADTITTLINQNQVAKQSDLNATNASLADKTNQVAGINNVKQYNVKGDGISGDSDTIQAMINTVRQKTIDNGLTSFYTIEIPSGTYIIDKEIQMSPYIKFKSNGIVIFKITFSGTAFYIAPQATDPVYSSSSTGKYHLFKNIWNKGHYFDGSNGGFVFTSTLDLSTNSPIGIEIGSRDKTMNLGLPTSRYVLENVNMFGLDTAIKLNTVNNYIGTFKHCHIEGNNHAVWFICPQDIGKNYNSGENMVFDNCVFAGQKKETVLINSPGQDVSFMNCSFDFNSSPVFRSLNAGISLRLNNCYLEKIGDGTGEQYIYSSESTLSGETGGRNTFYAKNFITYLQRASLVFKNVPNSSNGYINLHLDIDGMELRYQDTTRLQPYKTDDRFLVDSPSVTLRSQKILNGSLIKSLISPTASIISNGDFAQSVLGTDLTTANDPYWNTSVSNISNPTIVAEGVSGSNCVKYSITNTTSNYVIMKHKFSYPVEAGDIIHFSTLLKSDGFVPGTSTVVYYLECYNANGTLVTTKSYYDTRFTELTTADGTKFILPRDVGTFVVPTGITSVKPKFDVTNISGTFLSIDEVHISKSK
jgi:hypothetical protein